MTDRTARGQHAANLLDDDLLKQVFADIRSECIEMWSATGFMATAERERVWSLMKAVEKIEGNLMALVDDGKMAAAQMVQEQARTMR